MRNISVKKSALVGLFLLVGAGILPMAARASLPWHWHMALILRPQNREERKIELRAEMLQKRQELMKKFESRKESLKETWQKRSEEGRRMLETEHQVITSVGSTTPESTTTPPYDLNRLSQTIREDIKNFFERNAFLQGLGKIF